MKIKSFEELIKSEVSAVILKIFGDVPTLPIDVRQGERVGDAISKFIESKFEEYTKKHPYFKDSQSSPTLLLLADEHTRSP